MKKIKLLALVCMIFALTVVVVACGSGSETTTPAETTTVPETTTEPIPTKLESVKIGDVSIADFTIVYARSSLADTVEGYLKIPNKKDQVEILYPVYDYDKETADRLATLIYEMTGVELPVKEDKSFSETANEILVGKTNRSQTSSLNLSTDRYLLKVDDGKLVICGGVNGTTWHAIDYIEKAFNDSLAERKTDYAFASDYSYTGDHHMIRIGCIGDSITDGIGASNEQFQYTSQLGRFLWKDAIVYDYGSSGATMRNDLQDTYTKRDQYLMALKAAANTDLFTIMLGTNDSDRDKATWTKAKDQLYIGSCKNIMQNMMDKNPNLKFVVSNCPAYYDPNGKFGSAHVRQLAESMIPELNEAGYPTTFFDMYSVTAGHSEWFPDKLHPNDEGHMNMAKAWAASLQEIINQLQEEK